MGVFRLGHISDLHFSQVSGRVNPLEGLSTRAAARKALKVIFGSRSLGSVFYPSSFDPGVAADLRRVIVEDFSDLDALVVTGDLATTGDDADLSVARAFFTSQSPSWLQPFAQQSSPVDVIDFPLVSLPGNHDRYDGLTLAPGSPGFERHFGTHWDFDRGDTYVIGGSDPRVRMLSLVQDDDSTALVIGLADFALGLFYDAELPFGYVGQGKAHVAVAHELARCTRIALREAREAGFRAAAIWAVHFPPNFPNVDDRLRLLDSEILLDAAADCGVRAFIAGHTHQQLMYEALATRQKGEKAISIPVHCSGATTGLGPDATFSFSVLDVAVSGDDAAQLRVEHHRYDSAAGVFALVP